MTETTPEAMPPSTPRPAAAPARPAVPFGSVMLVVGGLAMVIAPYLLWYRMYGSAYDGFSRDPLSASGAHNRGWLYIVFGAPLLVCGVVQLLARRVTAVAAASVAIGVLALVVCLGFLTNAADLQATLHVPSKKFHWEPGQWVGLAGAMVALAGGVGTLTRRVGERPATVRAVSAVA